MTIFSSAFEDVATSDQTVTERVFEGLVDRPDEVVLTDGSTGESMTASMVIDQVKRLAGGLTEKGFGAGKTVAIMAPNSPDYCVVFHAVVWAGGTITTLNPTYTAPEVTHQLQDANADILITVPAFLDIAQAGAQGRPVIAIGTQEYDSLFGDALPYQVPVDLDTFPAVLPYSSGTTGLPKGVMLSHRNLVVNLNQTLASIGFRKGEVTAAFLPFFHIYGMTCLMNIHLAGGGALVTMPRFDLPQFLQISQDYKTTRMWVVPPVALALAKHPLVDDYDLGGLEQIVVAAAPSGAELTHALSKRLNCIALQGYGMTELSPVSHINTKEAPRAGAAGVLIPNTFCKIVNIETGETRDAGQEGELWIKGPQVMIGYLNNPTATTETITKDGWLKTGDIGYVDDDGYLFIVDRLKELIKFKGFQVAPAELEATLVAMEGIIDAAVIGIPDEEAGEVPMAFVIAGENPPDEAAIHAYFGKNLSSYKQLARIEFTSEIPKSASGKILRRVLRDRILQDD